MQGSSSSLREACEMSNVLILRSSAGATGPWGLRSCRRTAASVVASSNTMGPDLEHAEGSLRLARVTGAAGRATDAAGGSATAGGEAEATGVVEPTAAGEVLELLQPAWEMAKKKLVPARVTMRKRGDMRAILLDRAHAARENAGRAN